MADQNNDLTHILGDVIMRILHEILRHVDCVLSQNCFRLLGGAHYIDDDAEMCTEAKNNNSPFPRLITVVASGIFYCLIILRAL